MSSPTDRLRADAENAFRTAVRAVQPGPLIAAAVRVEGPRIEVAGRELPAVAGRRLLAAVGKAAPGLATAWLRRLPGWADRVLVITPRGVPVDPELEAAAAIRRGSHPFPDAAGEAAAREVLARAGELGEDDLLVLLLSGGGSALLAAPEPGLGLDQVITVTRELLASGAPIGAVNTVRREILAAAGGGLARAAFPARVLTLVISDVIGDPLPDIASGPTVASPTGPADALAVLERYRITGPAAAAVAAFLRRRLAAGARDRREWTRRTRTVVLANNPTAVEADYEIAFFDAGGNRPPDDTGVRYVTLPPYSMTQLSDPFAQAMGGEWSDVQIRVTCTTEGAGGFAYAAVVDNATNDAYFVRGVKRQLPGE